MTETASAAVARVAPQERIANLDVLRGIAILLILVMNIPYMGAFDVNSWDPRIPTWTAADYWTTRFIGAYLDGTQRGLLEMLFGAGIMIMTRAAMRPDGPVAVADLHYRRNLLLMALGAFQALVLFWPGDILFPYGLVAIFVFPFRGLPARWKAVLGVAFILVAISPQVVKYAERTELQATAASVAAKVAAHKPVTKDEQAKLDEWNKKAASLRPLAQNPDKQKAIAEQKKQRLGSIGAYADWTRAEWVKYAFGSNAWFGYAEIFGTMLLGAALFEWGVLQGRRSATFYLGLMAVGYVIGVPVRWLGDNEHLTFQPIPKVGWITWDMARIALCLGHIGLINLALKSELGRTILSPFQATGKMPLTTYLGASLICCVILFPGFGFGLTGKYGEAGLEAIAVIVMAAQLAFANLWLMAFDSGPLEWVWKSAAYRKAQPFRKATGQQGALAAAE